MTRLAVWIATAGGAGYAPVAPGTAGAVLGVLVHLLVRSHGPVVQVSVLAGLTLLGVWSSCAAAAAAGRKDPSHVVIDEVAGQALTFAFLAPDAFGVIIGFMAFRALDILKPWPVRQLEALPTGFGIMADDLMAGLYGWLVVAGWQVWHPRLF